MNALVIYDATGRIWNISYGETSVFSCVTLRHLSHLSSA